MKGGRHDGGTWSSPVRLGDQGECLSSTVVGAQRVFKMLGAMDSTCIAMVVDASGKDDAGGCGDNSILATAGSVGSNPWSAGGTLGEHTAGEGARKINAGLPSGVEVCMEGGGGGSGWTISVLDLRLFMSW